MDNEIPLAIPRSRRDASKQFSGVLKNARDTLSEGEKLKLKNKCESGLTDKFDLLTYGELDHMENLRSLYSVTMKIEEFQSALMTTDMHGVFMIPSEMADDPTFERVPAQGASTIDLFYSHGEVSLEQVRQFSAYLMMAGQDYHVQNLIWSGTKLLDSCSETLRSKIIEKSLGDTVEYKSGIVYFKIMMMLIAASSPKSMRLLLNRLQTMGLKDFD